MLWYGFEGQLPRILLQNIFGFRILLQIYASYFSLKKLLLTKNSFDDESILRYK